VKAIITFLDGKKSIIGTIVLGVLGVLGATGVIDLDNSTVQILIVVVTALTGIAFRQAIAKSGIN
jgi:hypothetical protein